MTDPDPHIEDVAAAHAAVLSLRKQSSENRKQYRARMRAILRKQGKQHAKAQRKP